MSIADKSHCKKLKIQDVGDNDPNELANLLDQLTNDDSVFSDNIHSGFLNSRVDSKIVPFNSEI